MIGLDRVRNTLIWLVNSLWLLPSLLSTAGIAAAYVVIYFDLEPEGDSPADAWWLFSGDAETARNLLSTLLAGLINMTSLVVSITMVVLSLAAGQLGPRLIWNFIADRTIQLVIGFFLATIVYTLLVLRSIDESLSMTSSPHLAVSLASLLAGLCLAALLVHISKLATAIVSDTMVNQVGASFEATVRQLPEEDRSSEVNASSRSPTHSATPLSIGRSGYVQVIDYPALCRIAEENSLVIRINVRAGHFLLRNGNHGEIESPAPVSKQVLQRIRSTVVIGADRTPTQDLEYSIRQLVEIALRALSPSLNDQFTAIDVVNRLSAGLELMATRGAPPSVYKDTKDRPRVFATVTDFEGALDAAFHQIRRSASHDPAVLIALGDRLQDLMKTVREDRQLAACREHLDALRRILPTIAEPEDRAALEAVLRARA